MPNIDLSKLQYKESYTQNELAKLWGYKNYHAIRRGIVTPAGLNIIILFVTKDKIDYATQYSDELNGTVLKMQGESKHGNDKRLLANYEGSRNDQIVLFYREVHHTPFIYYGNIRIIDVMIYEDRPSEFMFELIDNEEDIDDLAFETLANLTSEDKIIEGRLKYVQHIMRERDKTLRQRVIKKQGTICKICGTDLNGIYGKEIADSYIEVHHIKPLYLGEQEIDIDNDLITVCPNCHKMLHRKKNSSVTIEDLKQKIEEYKSIKDSAH